MATIQELLKTENYYSGVFCQDCMMAHENGDRSGNSDDWNVGEFKKSVEDYEILVDTDDHTEFSGERCFGCMTNLSGDRYAVTAFLRHDLAA